MRAEEEALLGAGEKAAAPAESIPGEGKVAEILANLTGQGSFDIIKIAAGGVQESVGRYDVDAWPEGFNLTLKEHGSGDYLLIFRDQEGKHAGRVMRTYRVPGSPAAPAAAGSGSSDLLALLKIQADKDVAHERSMSEMRLEMARQQAESTKLIVDALKAQSSGGLFKNAQDIALIAKLFKDDRPNALEQLMDAKDFLEDIKRSTRGETAAEESPLLALLTPVIAAIIPKITPAPRRRAATESGAAARIDAPAPVPPAAAAASPAAPADKGQESETSAEIVPVSLADYAPTFKAAIEGGAAPESAADFAVSAAREKGRLPELAELLEVGDWTALDSDPFLKEHTAWLKAFRARAEQLVFGETADASK